MKKIIAFALTLILLCSISSAFAATNHVVGTHGSDGKPVSDGVETFGDQNTSANVTLTVKADKIQHRYAVDVTFQTMTIEVSGLELTWNVNTLDYETTGSGTDARFPVTVTNYSDLPVYVSAAAGDDIADNLDVVVTTTGGNAAAAISKVPVGAAYKGGSTPSEPVDYSFDVFVAPSATKSWADVAKYYAGAAGAQTVGTCTVTIAKDNA